MIRKAILTLAALLIAASSVLAQAGIVTEFRGMKFGADLSQMEHMAPLDKGRDLKFYKKYQDDKTFQGVPVKDLSYGFYKNRFCVVLFSASGPSAYNTFKSYFDSTYGQPTQMAKNAKVFNYTCGEVSIELAYDDGRKVVAVQYAYMPLYRQMNDDMKAGKAKP
ncbi:hypothetical protein JCM15519_27440 [Fundidesulfovibrio butyratiphilus]